MVSPYRNKCGCELERKSTSRQIHLIWNAPEAEGVEFTVLCYERYSAKEKRFPVFAAKRRLEASFFCLWEVKCGDREDLLTLVFLQFIPDGVKRGSLQITRLTTAPGTVLRYTTPIFSRYQVIVFCKPSLRLTLDCHSKRA